MTVVHLREDNPYRMEETEMVWFRMNHGSSSLHARPILPNGRIVQFEIRERGDADYPLKLVCDGEQIDIAKTLESVKSVAARHFNTLARMAEHPVVVAPEPPPKEKTLAGGKRMEPLITANVVLWGITSLVMGWLAVKVVQVLF